MSYRTVITNESKFDKKFVLIHFRKSYEDLKKGGKILQFEFSKIL